MMEHLIWAMVMLVLVIFNSSLLVFIADTKPLRVMGCIAISVCSSAFTLHIIKLLEVLNG